MARYEGMDELLQRVRDHLDVAPAPDPSVQAPPQHVQPAKDQPYETALEHLLLLMHDSEQLRRQLTPGRVHGMTTEQQEDLRSILERVLAELTGCQFMLQRFAPTE